MAEKTASKINAIHLQLKGKLVLVDRFDGQNGPIFENLIVIPAADEYSSPSRFAVKSGHQIAQLDSMVDIKVELRSRYWKNQKNGKPNYVPELWLAA